MPSSSVNSKQLTSKTPKRELKGQTDSTNTKWGDESIEFRDVRDNSAHADSPSRESKVQGHDEGKQFMRTQINGLNSTQKNTARSRPGGKVEPKVFVKGRNDSLHSSLNDFHSNYHSKPHSEGHSDYKLFVGGLHYETTITEFRSYFERFGKVLFAEVMYARETHKPRGFGFVVFQSEQVMEKVCSEGPHVIDGKTVEVKRAVPRPYVRPIHFGENREGSSNAQPSPQSQQPQPVLQQQQQPAVATQQLATGPAAQPVTVAGVVAQQGPQSPGKTLTQPQQVPTQLQPPSPHAQTQAILHHHQQQQQQQQLVQHQLQQLQVHHLQQQGLVHSPHGQHHQQFTHLQLQHLQYQQMQQMHHAHNPYMNAPMMIAPIAINEHGYPEMVMLEADGMMYDNNMEHMHMERNSDVVTDTEYTGENSAAKLEMSEAALREEMCRWFISNVKIVRKVAEKYVQILYDAEVGSIDRLRKRVTRYQSFLRDLQFDLDDCEDINAALFKPPSSLSTGGCSPVSSSGVSLDGSAAAHSSAPVYMMEPSKSGLNASIDSNATAALANALSLGINSTNGPSALPVPASATSLADANSG